jgi:AbrB family looped-hinge helix DNA binding protein
VRLRARVGPKYQVVIPKEVRTILGIRRGDTVIFDVKNGELILRRERVGLSVEKLLNIVPEERKLTKKIDLEEIISSEVTDKWSTSTQTSSSMQ